MSDKKSIPVLQISLQLFKSLEQQEVQHCHWKSNEHLDEALNGQTDIDMLVAADQMELCERVLVQLHFKRIISQPWVNYPGIEDWIGFDEPTGKQVHVHLHYQILSGVKFVKQQRLPFEKIILKTKVKHHLHDVYVTDPSLEIVIMAVRIALKTRFSDVLKGMLTGKKNSSYMLQEMDYLLSHSDKLRVEKFCSELLDDQTAKKIFDFIYSNSFRKTGNVFAIKKNIQKFLHDQNRFGWWRIFFQHQYYFYKVYYIHRLFRKSGKYFHRGKRLPNGGLMIAFIGSDGSGKSTVSKEILKWLSWKVDAHSLYLGSGDGKTGFRVWAFKLFFKMLNKFLPKKKNKIQRKVSETPEEKSLTPTPKRKKSFIARVGRQAMMQFSLLLAKEKFRKIVAAKKIILNGGVIIADRFPQNQFPLIYDGPKIEWNEKMTKGEKRKFEKEKILYKKILRHSPDVVIKLLITPEEAIRRKPDHKLEEVQEKVLLTTRLQFPSSKVFEIDAGQPLEAVLGDVKKIIWNSL